MSNARVFIATYSRGAGYVGARVSWELLLANLHKRYFAYQKYFVSVDFFPFFCIALTINHPFSPLLKVYNSFDILNLPGLATLEVGAKKPCWLQLPHRERYAMLYC